MFEKQQNVKKLSVSGCRADSVQRTSFVQRGGQAATRCLLWVVRPAMFSPEWTQRRMLTVEGRGQEGVTQTSPGVPKDDTLFLHSPRGTDAF